MTEHESRTGGSESQPVDGLDWLFGKIRRHWPILSVALALLLLSGVLFAFIRGATAAHLSLQIEAAAKDATLGDPDEDELVVRAWVDRSPVRAEGTARLGYQFRNRSNEAVGNIQGQVRAPGFRSVRWTSSEVIPPGAERTFWVPLRPLADWGTYSVSTVLRWREGGRLQQGTVTIEGVRIVSPSRLTWWNAADSFTQLLALPVAIALLGWIFQFTQQHYALRRQEAQQRYAIDQQDRQQRYTLEQQAHQQTLAISRQAWASMLPTSHENNVNYYLPLLGSAGALLASVRRVRQQGPAVPFFDLLLMLRRNRQVPGLYLMDRKGEELVRELWDLFLERVLDGLTEAQPGGDSVKIRSELSALLDLLNPEESFSSFQKKIGETLGAGRRSKALQQRFATWATASPTDFDLLCLYRETLRFEVNRVYDFWYGKPQEFPPKAYEESREALKKALPQRPDRERVERILDRLDFYLAEVAPKRPGSGEDTGDAGVRRKD